MSTDKLKWMGSPQQRSEKRHFRAARPGDDYWHTEGNPVGAALSETYYFGFHVVEPAIHAYLFAKMHPNLNVLNGGALISRGFQADSLAASYYNMYHWLDPKEHLDPATRGVNLPGNLKFKLIEPMREWRLPASTSLK